MLPLIRLGLLLNSGCIPARDALAPAKTPLVLVTMAGFAEFLLVNDSRSSPLELLVKPAWGIRRQWAGL